MPRVKNKKKTSVPKSTTISIHGEGVDIDAEFASAARNSKTGAVGQSLADFITMLAARVAPTAPAAAVPPPPELDFHAVKRVIEHGDPTVLQAIITLARDKLSSINFDHQTRSPS